MPFGRGSTAVGSFPEIQISLSKPGASSTSMLGSGKENLYRALSSSSLPMRKPACKRDAVSNPPYPALPVDPCASNTSIYGKAHGPIWRPGTCIVPNFSDTAKRKAALLPPTASSLRSCAANPTDPPSASFGSWITARLIAVRRQSNASVPAGPMPFLYTPPFMPAGSIKLRSISPSLKERCSLPTISPRSHISSNASRIFKPTTNEPLRHSNGLSRAKTFMFFSTNYNPEPPLPRHEKIRHRNSGFEHLAFEPAVKPAAKGKSCYFRAGLLHFIRHDIAVEIHRGADVR